LGSGVEVPVGEDDFIKAARIILDADRVIALTGAGISVESGIPDFRSPGGLWSRYDPSIYATIESFVNDPSYFWSMAAELHPLLEKAEPNPAHLALSELESLGKCEAVITQNIDDLHQQAGSGEVLELHGTYRTGACIKCGTPHSYEELEGFTRECEVPCCRDCGGTIKPDVVLFGEPLNASVLHRARDLAGSCDLMLVVGCSLEVLPGGALPTYAQHNNAVLMSVNICATSFDSLFDIILLGQAGEVMPRIVRAYRELCKANVD
jgi:NAD-dependent protein deacetylase/lipoamidase